MRRIEITIERHLISRIIPPPETATSFDTELSDVEGHVPSTLRRLR
jgi:hypothetical protein